MATYNGTIVSPLSFGGRNRVRQGLLTPIAQQNTIVDDIKNTAVFFLSQNAGNKNISTKQGVLQSFGNTVQTKEQIYDIAYSASQGLSGIRKLRTNSGDISLNGYGNQAVIEELKTTFAATPAYADSVFDKTVVIKNGTVISAFCIESKAFDKYQLTVTPTHIYLDQSVNIKLKTISAAAPTYGKYRIVINNNEIIPYSEESVNFNDVDVTFTCDQFVFGKNNCKLELMYDDGTVEYLPFVVTREEVGRTNVERTFYIYDGGYDLHNVETSYNGMCGTEINGSFLATTDFTAIPTKGYAGIKKITANCDGAQFVVSFDNKNTWYKYDKGSGTWQQESISNVVNGGMDKETLESIPQEKWSLLFNKQKMHIGVFFNDYSDKALSTDLILLFSGRGRQLTYNVPKTHKIVYIKYWISHSGYVVFYDKYNRILGDAQGGHSITNTYFNIPSHVAKISIYDAPSFPGFEYCAMSVYGVLASKNVYSVNIELPPNQPPQVSNFTATPSQTHNQDVIVTAHLEDMEDNIISYKIDVNGVNIIPLKDTGASVYDIEETIPASALTIGTNAIKLCVQDDNNAYGEQTIYIDKVNTLPQLTVATNLPKVTFTLGDADGDTVRFRLLLNNEVIKDWTDFLPQPCTYEMFVPKDKVIIDNANTLTIEYEDNLGQSGRHIVPFVGTYYTLIATDVNGNVLADYDGTILKEIDLGLVDAGGESTPMQIFIKNLSGQPLNNVRLSVKTKPDNTSIKFCEAEDFTQATTDSITLIQPLAHGESQTLWIKAYAKDTAKTGGKFTIHITGDII